MIVALLIALAASPFSFTPPKPTVGDAITISARATPFDVRPSAEFEVISATPTEVVLRTFRPGPLRMEITTHVPGEVPETGTLEIAVASVLAPDDKLEPAPLRPPKSLPPDNKPFWIAVGVAAGVAALLWGALALLLRRRAAPSIPSLPKFEDPSEVFRKALSLVRARSDDESKWVMLSAATRRYLAATDPSLGEELTSFELLTAMRRRARRERDVATIESILRGGDWTKFSPFGAPRVEIDTLVDAAEGLIPKPVAPEVAA